MQNNTERREKTFTRLEELSIPLRLHEHPAAFTMEEMEQTAGELSKFGIVVKNLFLKEHNSDRYFLIVAGGNKRVDIKSVRKYLGVKPLSFATEEQLEEKLHVPGGSVTPLAVLFDTDACVSVVIDDDLRTGEALLGVHPCDNTATVFLTYRELEKFAESTGHTLINMQV